MLRIVLIVSALMGVAVLALVATIVAIASFL